MYSTKPTLDLPLNGPHPSTNPSRNLLNTPTVSLLYNPPPNVTVMSSNGHSSSSNLLGPTARPSELGCPEDDNLRYVQYDSSKESIYLSAIRQLISKDLSEPYSIYVYRYFLYQWGELCFMTLDAADNLIGVIICKLEPHRGGPMRGYIAMLAVSSHHRGKGIATALVRRAIDAMIARDADEIALETEISNTAAMKLYERLGFLRSKRLHRYYLNGNSAYRLVLYLKEGVGSMGPNYDLYESQEEEIMRQADSNGATVV